ncbi:MAG TPA: DinB family protein [Syntrophobacteraceae bacterium]|jgi:hypothetical protein|nr:DinB family protein [Syntrophobacteraceae bacterium]
MITRPAEEEFAPYYMKYVSLVPEGDLPPVLHAQIGDLQRVIASVSPERETYQYGPGKWSIREVLGHIIDGERVFGYRTFCISRGEPASLAIFDENHYVAMSQYDKIPLSELFAEFEIVRRSNLAFLSRLDEEPAKRRGIVGNNPVSVRAIAYIMVGHVRHHINVLGRSYGITPGAPSSSLHSV